MREVYFDHAASKPLLPEVVEAMLPYLKEHWGNPLSLHGFGERPREAMERARAQVADLIGAQPREIYFTASGSEANNMAIKGAALMNRKQGQHIVVSAIEHHSVLNSAQTLEKLGFEVTVVPVDKHGLVNPAAVAAAVREDTTLVSVIRIRYVKLFLLCLAYRVSVSKNGQSPNNERLETGLGIVFEVTRLFRSML